MTQQFYDELAPFYHLIFPDWEKSIEKQSAILDKLIKQEWGSSINMVLDVSCGIGTQAIGLAKLGYTVTASDLSPKEVSRAKSEANKRGLQIDFSVADMRETFAHHQKEYDLIISCDNSVPHLLSDEEIFKAFKEFYRSVKRGGGCLLTVRDYDLEERSGTQIKPYGIRVENGIKYLIFQVWEFDGQIYDLSMYFIRDEGRSQGTANIFRSKYYAVSPHRLVGLLKEAGFRQVKRIDGEFYQPVIVGTK